MSFEEAPCAAWCLWPELMEDSTMDGIREYPRTSAPSVYDHRKQKTEGTLLLHLIKHFQCMNFK